MMVHVEIFMFIVQFTVCGVIYYLWKWEMLQNGDPLPPSNGVKYSIQLFHGMQKCDLRSIYYFRND